MSVTGTAIVASQNKLDSVNEMLEAIGESPATALDTGGTSIEARAEVTLDRNSRRVQEEGWFENTDKDVTLSPDASDNIILDSDVLRVDTTGVNAYQNLSVVDGKLYDRDDQTDEFTGSVTVDIVRLLSFDNLSEKLRQRITKEASREFQRREVGGRTQDAFLAQEVLEARTLAAKSDQENADISMLSGTFARQILGLTNTATVTREG